MILVANKVDLSTRRKVSEEEGLLLAQRLGMHYIETSAKDPPQNIDEAFRQASSDDQIEMSMSSGAIESRQDVSCVITSRGKSTINFSKIVLVLGRPFDTKERRTLSEKEEEMLNPLEKKSVKKKRQYFSRVYCL